MAVATAVQPVPRPKFVRTRCERGHAGPLLGVGLRFGLGDVQEDGARGLDGARCRVGRR